ncbi:hypothetical protein HELRODRAFT_91533 [Helobdella robusta]|uniref:Peroxisomal membrane protein 11C n=1 Tax=Helobdella robusta TaxID=6412 RepID=T1G850_HELRO|nr:hypothetical protein HELRODRAFT_91533 [Helobdella robusta]ESO11307.1 hypothetical protein HELRODRAFT_91533 [Helobdella robusta]
METYVKLAQTFAGRDKLMRTTGYTLALISSTLNGDSSKKLSIVAKQISSARIIMRLFDDIPGFNNTKKMGADVSGLQERDKVCRILTIISNISTQVFYPCEHIAWMTDLGVLGKSSRSWWAASTSCWALSLLCSFLKFVGGD